MIPLFSPLRQNEPLFADLRSACEEVLQSGQYTLGVQVEAFEEALAKTLGYRHALGCSSGTDALILSLRALGLQPGDEVITPAFSFVASTNSIVWAGLTPVIVDVNPQTAVVNAEQIEAAITDKTRVVIAVDLYGFQCDIPAIRALCDRRGLTLIEDGAQSIGVPNRGAHFYTTSFYPTKILAALGDAGAILTDDPKLYELVKQRSRHGEETRDHYTVTGTNGRLDSLQAAFLRVKLPFLSEWIRRRREICAQYRAALKDEEQISLPAEASKPELDSHSLFTLRVPRKRNWLKRTLEEQGVGSGIYYPVPLHQQKPYRGLARFGAPHAERLAEEVLSLPLYPELTDGEVQQTLLTLKKCLHP